VQANIGPAQEVEAMAQSSNEHKMQYAKEHFARIEIAIPKDSKPILDAMAKAAGEKTAEYVKNAVLLRMGVKEWPVHDKEE